MNLTQATIEQWNERFSHDKSYADGKIEKVNECETTSDLIYHCMNIDIDGRNIIAEKLQMTPRDFAFFLSQFRALDQNNFYSGKNGFPYKEEEKIVDDITIVSTIYPDELLMKCLSRDRHYKGFFMPTLGGYVSQEIYNMYDAIAKEKGISKSKLVGQAIITSKIINTSEIENMELQKLREIQRIGANLNQIAKHCNIHKSIDVSVLQKLVEIERFLGDRQKT